ncbi:hypothetical protein CRI94_00075 [Longibacter salinarum]|uniref:Right handed beta helix domain-containing protein n=1 Tax=Longibacter salinarum TaxID=1850348 RepID=A0A2A8D1G7_9BACT|nr:right-handed parallel beta-helix repeat-containing protein [Longibacter salinarum]PEN14731.1 hypothetical protein CRI94_00075 [Longibacter salinarum]
MRSRVTTASTLFTLLSLLITFGSAGSAHAQRGDVVVDDDGAASVGNPVNCDGSGTTDVYASVTDAVNAVNGDGNLESIYICPGTYGADENVLIESNLTITGAGVDLVTLESSASDAQEEAMTVASGFGLSGIELGNFTIVHNSSGIANASTIVIGDDVDGVEIADIRLQRQGDLSNTSSAMQLNGTNIEVKNSEVSGGPIGFYGDPQHNYTIQNNTVRGAGDEAIWIVDGDNIAIVDNVIEATADGDAGDDYIGIAVYNAETSLRLTGNDVREITRSAVLLGAGIPIENPVDASVVPLADAGQMRSLVLANNTLGPVAFLTESDASTLRSESGNASSNATGVHVLRRTITLAPSTGGSAAYGNSALDAASSGDVIQLTNNATYSESVTLGKNLGFAVPNAAEIDEITLSDNVVVTTPSGTLTIVSALNVGLNTEIDGNAVVLESQASLSDGGLLSGRLQVTRTVGSGQSSSFGNIGLSLTSNGTTGPGEVTVTRIDGEPVTDGVGSINRLYDVTAATNTGLNLDVDVEYDDGSNGGDDELSTASVNDASLLGLFHSADGGQTWLEEPGVSRDLANNTFSVSGLSALGRYTLAEAGGALPVELASFSAHLEGQDVVLTWATTSETNNAGFRVQQKSAGAFDDVGFVDGVVNSVDKRTYVYRVNDLDVGPHTFRLEQVDLDGSTSLSDEVTVSVGLKGAYEVSPVSPNPVSDRAEFKVAVKSQQRVVVELFDALGRRVRTLYDGEMRPGTAHPVTVQRASLTSGHYFIRVQGEGFATTRRMVIVQ